MTRQPFAPAYGSNVIVTPGAESSAAVALDLNRGSRQVRIVNTGANVAFVRIGPADLPAATSADLPIPPSMATTISKDPQHSHFRHLSPSGTTLHVMLGEGF